MVLERLNVQPEQSTVDWHGASGVRGPLIFLSAYSLSSSISAAPGHPPQARTPTTTGTTTSST